MLSRVLRRLPSVSSSVQARQLHTSSFKRHFVTALNPEDVKEVARVFDGRTILPITKVQELYKGDFIVSGHLSDALTKEKELREWVKSIPRGSHVTFMVCFGARLAELLSPLNPHVTMSGPKSLLKVQTAPVALASLDLNKVENSYLREFLEVQKKVIQKLQLKKDRLTIETPEALQEAGRYTGDLLDDPSLFDSDVNKAFPRYRAGKEI